jgi:formylglycine-generating enzyme required for sulfatase activity
MPYCPFLQATDTIQKRNESSTNSSHDEMSDIPGGSFMIGGFSIWGRPDEFPRHKVKILGFYIDKHEVTNA